MAWERRIVDGIAQHRETPPVGKPGRWRIRVIGFDYRGDPGTCSIEAADGTRLAAPITKAGTVRHAGRSYRPRDWMH